MSAGSAVLESKALMGSFVADVRPERWSGADAKQVVADLADLARLVDAASLLFLGRVADCGNWKEAGHARVEEWLAATAGSSEGQAKERLQTARHLEDLPVTEQALRDGRLSAAQAGQVASGAAADASAEPGLLHDAQVDSFQTLRRKARLVRAAATPVDTGAIHATRYLRSWTGEDGAVEGRFRLTPDRGAQFLAALERFRRPIFSAARQSGHQEHAECYDADALVDLALAVDPASDGPRFEVQLHVRVDRSALLRGRTEPGETCEIDGIGPVPVDVVGHLAGEWYGPS